MIKYSFWRTILFLLSPLILSGCTSFFNKPVNYTGFLGKAHGVTSKAELAPISGQNTVNSVPPITLPNPAQATVILWMVGNNVLEGNKNDCTVNRSSFSIALLKTVEEMPDTYIYNVCSPVLFQSYQDIHVIPLEFNKKFRNVPYAFRPQLFAVEDFIKGRTNNMHKAIQDFKALGVPSSNIFLAGQSAGGYVSLTVPGVGKDYNGSIVFGPAWAGQTKNRDLANMIYHKEIKNILSNTPLQALVFAYVDDPFENSETLRFLRDSHPSTVTYVTYGCGGGHFTFSEGQDCYADTNVNIIKQYIQKQKANFPN